MILIIIIALMTAAILILILLMKRDRMHDGDVSIIGGIAIGAMIFLMTATVYMLPAKSNIVKRGYGRYNQTTGDVEMTTIGSEIYSAKTGLVFKGIIYIDTTITEEKIDVE